MYYHTDVLEKWAGGIQKEIDELIRNQLSKYGINEKCGFERVKVVNLSNDISMFYPECFPGLCALSEWYIDGKLSFSIVRKVDIKNKGIDVTKEHNGNFKITPNGKDSYACEMTVQYMIVEEKD